MPRNEQDPAANTQEFRAFAGRGGAEPSGSNRGVIVGIVIVAVVVVVAVVALASAL